MTELGGACVRKLSVALTISSGEFADVVVVNFPVEAFVVVEVTAVVVA